MPGLVLTLAPPTRSPARTRPHRAGAAHDCRAAQRAGRDRGYSTVEMVVILPVLVLFILAAVQIALALLADEVASGAARHGAQAARAYGGTNAEGRAAAAAYLDAVAPALLPGARIDVTRTPATVTVHIHSPGLRIPGVPVRVAADADTTWPIERFVAPDD
jgi:Flp pilus assembly protein TadG